MLMSLMLEPVTVTEEFSLGTSAGCDPVKLVERAGCESVNSNPQNQVFAPFIEKALESVVFPVFRSTIARWPGIARRTIGRAAVPVSLLLNVPLYVPPLSQMVSPGRTTDGCLSALASLQGFWLLPSPDEVPFADT